MNDVTDDDTQRRDRYDAALTAICEGRTFASEEVRSDAHTTQGVGSIVSLKKNAILDAARQKDNFMAERIAKSYPSVKNMVALVDAIRVQAVIERLD